ncbi:6-phosphogluconate dehydrogenase, decarboxylating [Octopus bimaculoides]|uniref:6-phosphogluconate dehydrogenase, decarboxylating n=1 Tax=Octopus bimaculoides TaxID=37653 RepID=UPI0022E8474F|nr:6-phosphogluconate dehydrogenase, decarboxylating [Octopus bimaculoides]
MSEQKADIALIGLAVMGQNLILNMNDNGYVVCAFNRTVSKVTNFLENEAKGTKVIGATSLEDMVSKLKKPRRVMMLVKAGQAVDDFIDKLVPLLEKGDIIIDGGNSEYQDTTRRCKSLEAQGLLYIGTGVSGGEEGARHGPSMMPGGSPAAWPHVKDIFQSISAKVGNEPCCNWVGEEGAGHFVKMVHNGIEYGDMQLICEAYHLMKDVLELSPTEMAQVFDDWNKEELNSYLIEITRDILQYKENGEFLLGNISDAAGQKGTGKWTAIAALQYGTPVSLIGEMHIYFILQIFSCLQALYASKIVSYAQGFMLMREAAKSLGWNLNYGSIALMWRGGCIIRSVFLGNIKEAFDKNPKLKSLLLDEFFKSAISKCQESWRHVVSTAVASGIPTTAFSSALAFYDGYRTSHLPANLIQAQRDYFGAHTYELRNNLGHFIHTNWTGSGGQVSSTTYQA